MPDEKTPTGNVFRFKDYTPQVDPSAFIAPGSQVIGQVTLGPRVHILFNCVLRGDVAPIIIGEGSNVQDNSTLHVNVAGTWNNNTEGPCIVGRNVSIGHNCLIHACTVEDECLIGMGAVIMSRAVIGRGSIVGAGAVVLEDTVVPPYSVVVGNPAKVRKTLEPEQARRMTHYPAETYQELLRQYRATLQAVPYP